MNLKYFHLLIQFVKKYGGCGNPNEGSHARNVVPGTRISVGSLGMDSTLPGAPAATRSGSTDLVNGLLEVLGSLLAGQNPSKVKS